MKLSRQILYMTEIVKIAVQNKTGRLMQLLLDRPEEQVQITEALAKALPEN